MTTAWRHAGLTWLLLGLVSSLSSSCTGSADETPAGGASSQAGAAGDDPGAQLTGVNTEMSRFVRDVWLPSVGHQCLGCHIHGGLADQAGSRFSLSDPTQPNYLRDNLAMVRATHARPDPDTGGASLLLTKAAGRSPHPAGQVLDPNGAAYRRVVAFLNDTSLSAGGDPELDARTLALLHTLDDPALLRRAALHLGGRLPLPAEEEAAAGGRLDEALLSILRSPSFGDFVLKSFDGVFLNMTTNINNVGLDTYSYNDNIYPPGKPRNYGTLADGTPVFNGYQLYWYESDPAAARDVKLARFDNHDVTQYALATMGLQRMVYLATGGHDYREALTGDYLLLNPWSARAFSSSFDYDLLAKTTWNDVYDPNEYRAITLTDRPLWPTVGMISDGMFLNTFSTTATNRQRKRVATLYRLWMGFDPLTLGQRPANLNQLLQAAAADPNALPPTVANVLCTSCHAVIDPPANALSPYGDGVGFFPPDGGFGPARMLPAGYQKEKMPADASANPAKWVAERWTGDPRFARGAVTFWFNLLTGLTPLGDPPSTVADVDSFLAAQRYQDAQLTAITDAFVTHGYNIQVAILGILKSPYYRGVDIDASAGTQAKAMLDTTMSLRWIGPWQLNAKLRATTGKTLTGDTQWNTWGFSNETLVRDYLTLLSGNIDGPKVTQPVTNPTSIMVRATAATASQLACQLVAADLALPAQERRLLAAVEAGTTPDSAAGAAAIDQTIAQLVQQVLGSDPVAGAQAADVADAQALFRTTLANSRGAGDTSLPAACQAGGVTDDPAHTLKSWLAVVAFVLADPRVVME